jgi:dTDP-4-dehydrorhamnose reductase
LSDKKTILIVGADSDLGTSLANYLNQNLYELVFTSRKKNPPLKCIQYLDLSDKDSIENLNLEGIEVSVICASITDQKKCEEDPMHTYNINVEGTLKLIERLSKNNVHIIFPSTSLVYDGAYPFQGSADSPNPKGKYASYKYEVEKEILKSYSSHATILRLSKLITINYPLFLEWHSALSENKKIFPFGDLLFSPISINFAAQVIERIIQDKIFDTLNLSAINEISYYDALTYIAKNSGFSVSKITEGSAKIKLPDLFLPSHSTLDTSQLENLGIIIPPSEYALDFFINEIT